MIATIFHTRGILFSLLIILFSASIASAQNDRKQFIPRSKNEARQQGETDASPRPRKALKTEVDKQNAKDAALKYSRTIQANDLEAHLSFLSDDLLEGRETGERGQKLAAAYLASQFKKFGLQPGYTDEEGNKSWFQPFELVSRNVKNLSITIEGKNELELFQDWVTFSVPPVAKSFNAKMVFAGYGISTEDYDNYEGLDVKDKMVVVLHGEPKDEKGFSLITGNENTSEWTEKRRLKTKLAMEKGARGLVVLMTKDEFEPLSGNRYLKYRINHGSLALKYIEDTTTHFPAFYLSEDAGEALLIMGKSNRDNVTSKLNQKAKVPKVKLDKLSFELKADVEERIMTGENVLGFLPGKDKKDEVVVLTAHYDHLGVKDGEIYNGADDDGSGTSTIVELAEAFSNAYKDGYGPRRSILFMPVSGEEKGLLGSQYYADHPAFPLKKTVCNLNIDMIGRIDPKYEKMDYENYVYIIGSDKLSTELHDANEAANKKYTKLKLDYTYNDPEDPNRFYYRSDHYNFAKNGIPVIFYFTGVHEDYHKATDTIEKIRFEKMATIARLVFTTAWDVANREKKLEVNVENDFPSDR